MSDNLQGPDEENCLRSGLTPNNHIRFTIDEYENIVRTGLGTAKDKHKQIRKALVSGSYVDCKVTDDEQDHVIVLMRYVFEDEEVSFERSLKREITKKDGIIDASNVFITKDVFNDIRSQMIYDSVKINASFSIFKFDSDFSNIEIADANFYGTIFESEVSFKNSIFGESSDFCNTVFKGEAMFEYSKFFEEAKFWHSKFYKKASLSDSTFKDDCTFRYALFEDIALFRHVKIAGDSDFVFAKFYYVDFSDAKFGGDSDFTSSIFQKYKGDSAKFFGCRFLGSVYFFGIKSSGIIWFNQTNFYSDLNLTDSNTSAIRFYSVNVDGNLRFPRAISKYISLMECVLSKEVDFSFKTLEELELRNTIFLSDVTIKGEIANIDLYGSNINGKLTADWNLLNMNEKIIQSANKHTVQEIEKDLIISQQELSEAEKSIYINDRIKEKNTNSLKRRLFMNCIIP